MPDEPITIELHKSFHARLPRGATIVRTIPRFEWVSTPTNQRRRRREVLIEFEFNNEQMTMIVPRRLHKWREQ